MTLTLPVAAYARSAGEQTISSAKVKAIAEDALRKCLPGGDISKIREMHVPEDFSLPAGALDYTVEDGKIEPEGKFSMKVIFRVEGHERRTVWVWGRAGLTKKVLTAARMIKKQQVITEDDVVYSEVEKNSANEDAVTDISDAVGMAASRQIKEGTPIKTDYLKQCSIIKRGEQVRLIAKSHGIVVTATGIAKEEGMRGGRIKVENAKSGKVIIGSVAGEGVVEVVF